MLRGRHALQRRLAFAARGIELGALCADGLAQLVDRGRVRRRLFGHARDALVCGFQSLRRVVDPSGGVVCCLVGREHRALHSRLGEPGLLGPLLGLAVRADE